MDTVPCRVMNKIAILKFTVLILLTISCDRHNEKSAVYTSDRLIIHTISKHAYVHESYIQTESFGNVACNGLIYVNQNEAIIFDTPPDTLATKELLDYVTGELKATIVAVVPTHFHEDCLGGLGVVHSMGIVSIANQLTIELSSDNEETTPLMGFDTEFSLPVGDQEVWMGFRGEGHTRDNIVGYIPDEKIMFGGCLIKKVGASKGYTGDANLDEWSNTVRRIKSEFPDTKLIIPGHGPWGDQELFDYTTKLFEGAGSSE